MRLILVRHPRPDIAPGLCYGRSDVPVAAGETERVHQRLLAAGLPRSLPRLLPIYASPLRRCAGLAHALAAPPLAPTFDPRLAEMDFGDWEMRGWDNIPIGEVDAWAADLLRYRPGGGECVLDVARRVDAFRRDLLEAGHAAALVICHAGTMRLLHALHGARPLHEAALDAARTPHHIGYGEMLLLQD